MAKLGVIYSEPIVGSVKQVNQVGKNGSRGRSMGYESYDRAGVF